MEVLQIDFAGVANGKEFSRDTSDRWSFDEDGTYSVGAVGDSSGYGGIKQVTLSPNDLTSKVRYVQYGLNIFEK